MSQVLKKAPNLKCLELRDPVDREFDLKLKIITLLSRKLVELVNVKLE